MPSPATERDNYRPQPYRIRRPLPLIGTFAVGMQLQILATAFLLFFIAAAFVGLMDNRAAGHRAGQIASIAEMQSLGERIARAGLALEHGQLPALEVLRASRTRFAELQRMLVDGGNRNGSVQAPVPVALKPQLDDVGRYWASLDRGVQAVLGQEKRFVALARLVDELEHNGIHAAALAAQAGGAWPDWVERVARNVELVNADAVKNDAPALQLVKDLVLAQEGVPRQPELSAMIKAWQISGADLKGAQEGKHAAAELSTLLSPVTRALDTLAAGYDGPIEGRGGDHLALLATFGSLALGTLVLMIKVYGDDAAQRREEAERQRRAAEAANAATQQSVRHLTEEMTTLADGDLTVRATVTEDLTGVIADAVNYAIGELSVLVGRINDAAGRLAAATSAAAHTSDELLAASDRQSDEIRDASGQVLSMAQSMETVSTRSRDTASAARQSLETAQRGAAAVADSIAAMHDIRQQIQETSKRIKRLGESSQEIGEIVALISDITEQTNVLALNAAIQAAAAGEAGRGFSVVAEEVQRLAERSGDATKRIAVLVRTIQADTNETVAAMERSTQNVVKGAQLSDATGQALADISRVSGALAEMIEDISGDTQHQAQVATQVAGTMRLILTITEQTSDGTQQTAVSLGELAELAAELKGSVAGFKV
ncbi:MAG: methyl-accepting chemotaxis protein [Proteobacteria bacterium]|nr:methyl-accepting chemotaxis protein [Pseudomonadota bacterium]HQR03825.1 methyl-accepting chemotaxis protein [Rhodocyclaceae bacterium]